ncbi:MAG: tol-pal system protein YbgF [bacterium]|nr:tol-pal system protein YbgF [bacterium]
MKKLILLFIFGGLCLPGCFATREEMATLKEDLARLQEQVGGVQQGMNKSTSKIKIGQADIGARMDTLELDQQKVEAKVDESNNRIDKVSLRIDNLEAAWQSRLKALEDRAAAELAVSSEKLYQVAYTDYTKGNFDLAVMGFRQYLEKYPSGVLADSAQYWIGECFFSQQKYAQSIEEFKKVPLAYAQSVKNPAAQLKIALALELMDKKEEALRSLDEVIAQYPDSDEAKAAAEKKKELQKPKKKE